MPFYGTVYKSSRYDLIIPLPACESGAEREKRHAVVFASGKTGTNSASFSVSRNGDCGNPLAAGEILPPFCVYARRVAAVAVVVGAVAKSSEKALVKPFCEKNFTEFLARVEKIASVFTSSPPF